MENAYQEFLAKLEDAKQSVKEDESLRIVLENTEKVYSALKNTSDVELYKKIMPGFSIISIVICLVHILLQGFWAGLIGIIVMVAIIFYSRIHLNRRIFALNEMIQETKNWKLLQTKEVLKFIDYIEAGIDLKKFRFIIIMAAFSTVLPFVLISLSELMLGHQGILSVILAFIVSFSFAWILFQKDLSKLSAMKNELSEIKELI